MAKQHKTTPYQDEDTASAEPQESVTPPEEPEVSPKPDTDQSEASEAGDITPEPTKLTPAPATDKKKFNLKAFLHTKKGKVVAVVAALVLIIGLVFAIPASRYAAAGLVVKKDLSVLVVDSETGKPVSAADISVANQTAKTDADGKVTLHNVPVGPWQVSAKKTYYEDTKGATLVPILSNQTALQLSMKATGRQVPISTTNKLTGAALGGVEITAGDATVTTADDGLATLVLPADKATVDATFKLDGFNTLTGTITVAESDTPTMFSLTPSGKVYFLSKRTGKINIMKSDLDGANASVAVAATGQEEETQTVLLASRDWKYLALQARRDSKTPKLYLVNTADDKLSVIDEGDDVSFSPIGWSNEYFVYRVTRSNVHSWEPKQQSLKSFNALTGKITSLDDSDGVGSGEFNWASETFTNIYIIGDQIIYAKYWNNYFGSPALIAGKKDAIYRIKANGEGKQSVKEFDSTTSSYIEAVLYRPDEIYFRLSGTPNKYFEYHDGVVAETTEVNDTNYYNQAYATYLVSPSGKSTFWYEGRDGKNVLFIGDAEGANSKEIMATNSFKPYGWYTDDYLLLAKNGSELFVLARGVTGAEPVKITDYHKPAISFPGYGYGYGGGD